MAALARFDLKPEGYFYFVPHNIAVPIHYLAIVFPAAVRDYILLGSSMRIPLLDDSEDKNARAVSIGLARSLCILAKIALQAHVAWLHTAPHFPVTAYINTRYARCVTCSESYRYGSTGSFVFRSMAEWESWLVHHGQQPFHVWAQQQAQEIRRRAMSPPGPLHREPLHLIDFPERFPAELADVVGMQLPADAVLSEIPRAPAPQLAARSDSGETAAATPKEAETKAKLPQPASVMLPPLTFFGVKTAEALTRYLYEAAEHGHSMLALAQSYKGMRKSWDGYATMARI
jgi:hypothetical protein